MAADFSEVVPPSNVTVDHERKPVLYLPDGRVLVRQAGFAPHVADKTVWAGKDAPKC